MQLAAIIPSLNPDERFLEVVTGLLEAGFERVYIVDDGSGPEYKWMFEEAARRPGVALITHEQNCGKGRALKNALSLYLEQGAGDCIGVVTVDGDGQHQLKDTIAVAEGLVRSPEALVLGVRDFDSEEVPQRSSFGNKVTRGIMRLSFGIKVSDTQTGLRAIPNSFAAQILGLEGERYEFETNMLIHASKLKVPIAEVPIGTIYIDDNSKSHFRPLVDSIRIMGLILKFAMVSICSAGLDYLLFWLFGKCFASLPGWLGLFAAVALARLASATFNFTMNKRLVFHSGAGVGSSAMRYVILAASIMLCSYGGLYLLSELLPLPQMLAKLITDVTLFIVSFRVQRRWVF